MRKTLFWLGWAILFALPIAFCIEIYQRNDLPVMYIWKWAILGFAVLLVIFARNRDDVLEHHIV
jgi:lipid-A-disaccharide synthase-like uncharacterized protein